MTEFFSATILKLFIDGAHAVAVSSSIENLRYMSKTIFKHCEDNIEHMACHAVKEIAKDVYGGVTYKRRKH